MTTGDLIGQFRSLNVVVVGDVMVDEYVFGRAERISPEAPVMVIRAESKRRVPGGAANVARNIAAMGAQVVMVGVVGNDEAGKWLTREIGEFSTRSAFYVSEGRQTTLKTRIIADHSHQVLRIDEEDDSPISEPAIQNLIDELERLIPTADAVLLSDYLKGTLAERVVRESIEIGKSNNKVVIANPKPESCFWYEGATLLSLNRAEASKAAGKSKLSTIEDAIEIGNQLRDQLNLGATLVTMGGEGMAVCHKSGVLQIPAQRVEVADPAGAGDTTIAAVALGVACAGVASSAVYETAALLAAAVVRHVGVAVPSAEDLESIFRLGKVS